MREKQKENGGAIIKRLTRKEEDKLREKWREAKTKQRSKITSQAKRRENERRKELYASKAKKTLHFC